MEPTFPLLMTSIAVVVNSLSWQPSPQPTPSLSMLGSLRKSQVGSKEQRALAVCASRLPVAVRQLPAMISSIICFVFCSGLRLLRALQCKILYSLLLDRGKAQEAVRRRDLRASTSRQPRSPFLLLQPFAFSDRFHSA
jgi:hypothetical protein